MFWTGAVIFYVSLPWINGDCIIGFQQLNSDPIYVSKVEGTWQEINDTCSDELKRLSPLQLHTNLTEAHKQLCGNVFVAIDIEQPGVTASDWQYYDPQFPRLEEGRGALNRTTGLWHLVNESFLFSCAVCQIGLAVDLNGFAMYYEESEISVLSTYQITMVSKDVHAGPAEISESDKKALLEEVKVPILKIVNSLGAAAEIDFHSTYTDADNHFVLVFYCNVRPVQYYEHYQMVAAMESKTIVYNTPNLQKYDIEVKYVVYCPEEKTYGQDGKEYIWPEESSGGVCSFLDEASGLFARRECIFNTTEHRRVWSTPTYWSTVWRPCSLEEQYDNEVEFRHYLSSDLALKHANFISKFNTSPVNKTTLDFIVKIINTDVSKEYNFNPVLLKEVSDLFTS